MHKDGQILYFMMNLIYRNMEKSYNPCNFLL